MYFGIAVIAGAIIFAIVGCGENDGSGATARLTVRYKAASAAPVVSAVKSSRNETTSSETQAKDE